MSGLKISTADIPYNSKRIKLSNSIPSPLTGWDAVGGPRYTRVYLSTAAASCSYTFDLGTDYASINSKADHFIVARGDLCLGTETLTIARSADDSSYTNVADSSTATALGPNSSDYIATFTQTDQYRYWKATFSSGSTSTFAFSKIFLGSFLTFTQDPDFNFKVVLPKDSMWYSSSGAGYSARTSSAYYEFDLKWEHQTDAKVKEFEDKVVRHAEECPVFLYESATPYTITDSKRLFHVALTDYSTTKVWSSLNTIEASFRELVG